jgi:5-methylcytosine-specific restriction endonuclease McrA
MIDWLRCKFEGRSTKWRSVRNDIINVCGFCAACHASKNLEVHHIIPFNLRPDLELNYDNLMVLCKHCHLTFGHYNDYRFYNANVKNDSVMFSLMMISNKKRFAAVK